MKNQKKNKKVKLRVIQQNKVTGHPSYPFSESNNTVKAVGFTHDDKEEYGGKEKLMHNINPKDTSDCYVKLKVESFNSKFYEERTKYKDYRIHQEDQPTINRIIRKSKKKDRH